MLTMRKSSVQAAVAPLLTGVAVGDFLQRRIFN